MQRPVIFWSTIHIVAQCKNGKVNVRKKVFFTKEFNFDFPPIDLSLKFGIENWKNFFFFRNVN